jgi:peptidoglycan L-alanyl-D-glutamate endopeptidase CwlK
MSFKFSRSSLNRLNTVNCDLKEVAMRAIDITTVDFGIPQYGGLRTVEEQQALYKDGKSMCDGIEKPSYHQSGNALDFYAYVDGKASWKKEHLAMVAAAFLQAASELGIKLEWGGLWRNFVDMPHVQLTFTEK